MVMFVYCGLVWQGGRISEEAGDSIYYLGFSFTLVALIVAMAGAFFKQEAIQVNQIVEAFGIALLTTLIGLVARVILLSLVDESAEREPQEIAYDEARYALRELQAEVQETIQSLSKWRNEAAEHWRGVREAETNGVRRAVEAQEGLWNDQALALKTRIGDAYAGLGKVAEDAISQIKTTAEKSTEEVKQVALSGIGEITSASGASRNEIVAVFAGVSKQLERELEDVQEIAGRATGAARTAVQTFEESTRAVQLALEEALSDWAQEVKKTAGSIGKGVAEELKGWFAKVAESTEDLSGSVAKVSKDLSEVSFDGIIQATGDAEKLIHDGFTALSNKISGLGEQLAASFPSEGEYRTAFKALYEALSEAVKQNQLALRSMKDAAEKTGASFAEAGEELRKAGLATGFDTARIAVNSLTQSMEQHGKSLTSAEQTMAQFTGKLSEAAGGVSSVASELAHMLNQWKRNRDDIGEIRDQLSAARAAMIEDLLSSQQTLRMVMNTLSEGVKQLRGEIKSERKR
ncbi:hypothetical protein ACFL0Q_02250 [Thermodesulfobacteriota bacterium]